MELTPLEIFLILMLLSTLWMMRGYERMLTDAHKRYDELSDMVDKIFKSEEENK